ncbi:lysine transporter LysE [Streptomyces sp. NRRL F-4489]|uniref:LysE family translocator n=1 Tax=Streptomyces sp. NRRL F-4489 TaxID=1609095 RepID=UPI000748733E|nr:LysE family translocator [Streptomyces sp. NRRL F-4489]KUL46021.1 lysine transporter LysE [Streptomyces sp. NRRL F-4489]
MTTAVVSFSLFALLVTMAPGPDTLLVLRNCLRGGRFSGIATALGAAAGSLAWAVAAAVGLAAVLQRWDVAFTAIRLAGAAYLIFLGVQSLWAYRRGAGGRPEVPGKPTGPVPTTGRAFRQGVLSCLLNPKVGIFFVAVVPQFLPNGHSALSATLVLGVIDAAIAALWLTLVAVFAARMMTWLRRPRVNTALERTAAGVLVALGIGTAAETV